MGANGSRKGCRVGFYVRNTLRMSRAAHRDESCQSRLISVEAENLIFIEVYVPVDSRSKETEEAFYQDILNYLAMANNKSSRVVVCEILMLM